MAQRFTLLLLCLTAAACGPAPRGVYDEETGLVGAVVSEGSLAGTWAHSTFFSTLVPIPVLGDRPGGGGATRLVTRRWLASERVYEDTFIRCTNEVLPVEGTQTIVRPETLSRMSPITHRVTVDHKAGTFLSADVIDLWGVRNLPEPLTTALPTKDNFKQAPQSGWMFDEDADSHPGVTVFMRGTLTADLYVVKRNVYVFDGTIVTEDRVQGVNRTSISESNSVESTVGWVAGEGTAKPSPDPLASWFDMIRLKAGAGCPEVVAAVAEGRLATTRPFKP